ncbi:concanavalin A-like lectin/glucanase, partial [Aureobasidium namibiae CBS 147.97]
QGAVHSGKHLREVSADIVLPKCSVGLPYSQYDTYESDGWVGIGGYSAGGLIQTGVSCYVQQGKDPYYKMWTEFYPALETFYEDENLRAGDVISARVVAHSESSGTTYLHNKRTGKKFSKTYTNETSELNFEDVEWVTESRLFTNQLGPQGSPDAKFTPWEFRNAAYAHKGGKKQKFRLVTGSHMLDTVLNNATIAKGILISPGHIQVNDTTPTNFTVPGFP